MQTVGNDQSCNSAPPLRSRLHCSLLSRAHKKRPDRPDVQLPSSSPFACSAYFAVHSLSRSRFLMPCRGLRSRQLAQKVGDRLVQSRRAREAHVALADCPFAIEQTERWPSINTPGGRDRAARRAAIQPGAPGHFLFLDRLAQMLARITDTTTNRAFCVLSLDLATCQSCSKEFRKLKLLDSIRHL